ncbi:MAG TPA: nuclear transport factor 2 family protein [Saprospiraceae bacterium]|nr:nuclear transport factor 2 family protein [Saprospiraceae bacterium]
MKKSTSLLIPFMVIIGFFALGQCSQNKNSAEREKTTITPTKSELQDEAWHMEELYWEYVQNIDTVAYKTLWHEDFIGYPSFGDGVSGKSKIATWITDLHKDPEMKYSYVLHKKASNAIEDVVMVFYDTDYFWTNKDNQVVRKETYKFSHTWKNVEGKWLILGGMAASKNQDLLKIKKYLYLYP